MLPYLRAVVVFLSNDAVTADGLLLRFAVTGLKAHDLLVFSLPRLVSHVLGSKRGIFGTKNVVHRMSCLPFCHDMFTVLFFARAVKSLRRLSRN